MIRMTLNDFLAWGRSSLPARLERKLESIDCKLDRILRKQGIEMAQIDDLNAQLANMDAEVAHLTAVDESAAALLVQLKAAVDAIVSAPDLSAAIAMAQAISTKMADADGKLADAVVANTPAAP